MGRPRGDAIRRGRPSSGEEAWSRLLRYVGHWSPPGHGYWAVRERETGRFVGEVGFADFRRDIQPSLDGVPEVGWVLASWSHRRRPGPSGISIDDPLGRAS